MRNTKFIAVVAALAMMFMGVGYSYWSQTIPIKVSGTVASFEVNIAGATALDADGNEFNSDTYAYAQHTKDEVTLVACRMNAGDTRTYIVTFSNVGDVKASINQVDILRISGGDILKNVSMTIDNCPSVTLDQDHVVSPTKAIGAGRSSKMLVTVTLAPETILTEERVPFSFKIIPVFAQ